MLTTSARIYFENPVGRILEHPNEYAVVIYNAGPRQLHHFQAFLTHTGQLLRRNGWFKILGDQRLMSPFTEEEQKWVLEYWLARPPEEAMHGAVLLPHDVFARLSLSQVMSEAKTAALTYRMFEDEYAAGTWLNSLKAPAR